MKRIISPQALGFGALGFLLGIGASVALASYYDLDDVYRMAEEARDAAKRAARSARLASRHSYSRYDLDDVYQMAEQARDAANGAAINCGY